MRLTANPTIPPPHDLRQLNSNRNQKLIKWKTLLFDVSLVRFLFWFSSGRFDFAHSMRKMPTMADCDNIYESIEMNVFVLLLALRADEKLGCIADVALSLMISRIDNRAIFSARLRRRALNIDTTAKTILV